MCKGCGKDVPFIGDSIGLIRYEPTHVATYSLALSISDLRPLHKKAVSRIRNWTGKSPTVSSLQVRLGLILSGSFVVLHFTFKSLQNTWVKKRARSNIEDLNLQQFRNIIIPQEQGIFEEKLKKIQTIQNFKKVLRFGVVTYVHHILFSDRSDWSLKK